MSIENCYKFMEFMALNGYMDEDKAAMDFWGRVEIAQKEAGIPTLKQLCESANASYNTMTNKRSMGKLPNLSSAVNIAKEVGCSVEWLLLGEQSARYESRESVANAIKADDRLFEIAKKLMVATPTELLLVETALKSQDK